MIACIYYIRKDKSRASVIIKNYVNDKRKINGIIIGNDFLKSNVFYELINMNDGFDDPSKFYFSQSDFEIVMDRIEKLGIVLTRITTIFNGEIYEERNIDNCDNCSVNSVICRQEFDDLKKRSGLLYSATYVICNNR